MPPRRASLAGLHRALAVDAHRPVRDQLPATESVRVEPDVPKAVPLARRRLDGDAAAGKCNVSMAVDGHGIDPALTKRA